MDEKTKLIFFIPDACLFHKLFTVLDLNNVWYNDLLIVTVYHLHLNSSDYRDSCYVKWFRASLCIATSWWANPSTIVTCTHPFRIVYGCPSSLHSTYAKACPESCDSNCLDSLRNLNLSANLWSSMSLYQLIIKSHMNWLLGKTQIF